MDKTTKYICPSCKKEQTSIGMVCDEITLYESDISKGEIQGWEQVDASDSDLESYYCPECGETIDNKFVKALNIDGLTIKEEEDEQE